MSNKMQLRMEDVLKVENRLLKEAIRRLEADCRKSRRKANCNTTLLKVNFFDLRAKAKEIAKVEILEPRIAAEAARKAAWEADAPNRAKAKKERLAKFLAKKANEEIVEDAIKATPATEEQKDIEVSIVKEDKASKPKFNKIAMADMMNFIGKKDNENVEEKSNVNTLDKLIADDSKTDNVKENVEKDKVSLSSATNLYSNILSQPLSKRIDEYGLTKVVDGNIIATEELSILIGDEKSAGRLCSYKGVIFEVSKTHKDNRRTPATFYNTLDEDLISSICEELNLIPGSIYYRDLDKSIFSAAVYYNEKTNTNIGFICSAKSKNITFFIRSQSGCKINDLASRLKADPYVNVREEKQLKFIDSIINACKKDGFRLADWGVTTPKKVKTDIKLSTEDEAASMDRANILIEEYNNVASKRKKRKQSRVKHNIDFMIANEEEVYNTSDYSEESVKTEEPVKTEQSDTVIITKVNKKKSLRELRNERKAAVASAWDF